MNGADVRRAVAAARSVAADAGLAGGATTVLQNSNKLAVRLQPCDVVARVAHVGRHVAPFEVEVAQGLAAAGGPVAALDLRVEPRVYERDGFAVTLWTYYEQESSRPPAPADYARALERLHAALRQLRVTAPHFTDRVAEAQALVASPDRTPGINDADRGLLAGALRGHRQAVAERGREEQLLHGEPHPGNVLRTTSGLRFIDLETCCRGPVELDVAHVPEEVSRQYGGLDRGLLDRCRGLVLAMVAAWRWDRDDQLPDGERAGRDLLRVIRDGPPWPTLDDIARAGP